MSATNFDMALDFTLKWEGGYVDDPSDPGGATKFGICKRSYPTLDIPSLTLDQAKMIYKRDYWDEAGCNDMEWPYDVVVFDSAVNVGVTQALNWYNNSECWQDFLLRRILHYVNLAKKTKFQSFLRGWLNRTMALYETVA